MLEVQNTININNDMLWYYKINIIDYLIGM